MSLSRSITPTSLGPVTDKGDDPIDSANLDPKDSFRSSFYAVEERGETFVEQLVLRQRTIALERSRQLNTMFRMTPNNWWGR